MSKATHDSEKDLELKLRFMRFLWYTGHLTRKNLNLTNLDHYRKGQSYTDVDVFGIKFDETFSPSIVIADCRTGKTTKKYERFFWLNGVMKYFGAKDGFFIRDNVDYYNMTEISNRLDIIPLSLSQLNNLEKIYNINESVFFGSFSKEQKTIDKAFKTIREGNSSIEEYIRFGLMGDTPNQQMITLISSCRELDKMSNIDKRIQKYVIGYALTMFSIALLTFTQKVLFISEEKKEQYIKQALLGGRIKSEERRKLLYAFYEFMAKEINERYKQKYPISRTAFVEGLVPPYTKYLTDLIIRVQNNPKNSIHMPRILDYLSHKILFNDKSYNIAEILPNEKIVDIHRLFRPIIDLLTFVERGGIINTENTDLFKEAIGTLDIVEDTIESHNKKKNGAQVKII